MFTYGNDPNNPFNSTASPLAPFGNYETTVAAVADGKVYLLSGEYDYQSPSYKGAATRAIDAYTGKELWKVYANSLWEEQAVADGYYVWFNQNDQQIYVTGPGPSSTTVTANNVGVTLGSPVEITGTVLDQSPLLVGTPAISDADQGLWTNYIVEHTAVEPNATGVPVQLTIKAQDGTITKEVTVTSDSKGLFHFPWTAEAPGEYTIVTNFAGTQSYGPSSAETAIIVASAPSNVLSTPAPVISFDQVSTYLGLVSIVIVIILAVVVVAVVRRRK